MKYLSIYILICLLAILTPFLENHQTLEKTSLNYTFQKTFIGKKLISHSLNKQEKKFYKNFSGIIKRFKIKNLDSHQLIFRFIQKPSRKLHPAQECYKAFGYKIKHINSIYIKVKEISSQPLKWSQFIIREDDQQFVVRQIIISINNNINYPDISTWYWKSIFSSKDKGPWLSIIWKLPNN